MTHQAPRARLDACLVSTRFDTRGNAGASHARTVAPRIDFLFVFSIRSNAAMSSTARVNNRAYIVRLNCLLVGQPLYSYFLAPAVGLGKLKAARKETLLIKTLLLTGSYCCCTTSFFGMSARVLG